MADDQKQILKVQIDAKTADLNAAQIDFKAKQKIASDAYNVFSSTQNDLSQLILQMSILIKNK